MAIESEPPAAWALVGPSAARRERLQEQVGAPTVSNFFPLEQYFDAAEKVHASFQGAFVRRDADAAYLYGKRYCYFCLEAIPEHHYYGLPKTAPLQKRHIAQTERVLGQLTEVVEWMDQEELERERLQRLEQERAQRERDRQAQERLEHWQMRLQQQQRQEQESAPNTSQAELEQSALAKLAKLQSNGHVSPEQERNLRIKLDPSGEEPKGPPSSRYRILDSESDEDEGTSSVLPPPLLPPTANGNELLPHPPSYQSIASQRPVFGSSKVHPAPPQFPLPGPSHPPSMKRPNMSQLLQQHKQAYTEFHQAGRIRVTPIPSYQGRIQGSTNGCTVISALCAAQHLRRDIDTDTIVRIIDQDCVPLLKQIRSKLGLGGCALIIPSDVHDDLVDRKILRQDDFEGAAGGNILDPQHFGSFTRLLAAGDDGHGRMRRAAATLFFREHVVSIVKLTGGGKPRFDLIDSLPGITNNGRPMATRTHCQDLEALEVMLKWYCMRKFSDSNCTYIDRNSQWDDAMADFDPRVFQGFVWMQKQ